MGIKAANVNTSLIDYRLMWPNPIQGVYSNRTNALVTKMFELRISILRAMDPMEAGMFLPRAEFRWWK